MFFVYGHVTLCEMASQPFRLNMFQLCSYRLFPFRSPLLRKSIFFLFLQLLRWFSSLRSLICAMYLRIHDRSASAGLPHSEIRVSMLMSSSTRLIAGYRVLHRLLMPRHSLYALFSFCFVFPKILLATLFVEYLSFISYAIFNQLSELSLELSDESCPYTTPFRMVYSQSSSLVGLGGLEPPTSRLSGVRSNHLSYKPVSWWR